MPPRVTAEMANGFTLYMLKAAVSGLGDEIAELARTNLPRRGAQPPLLGCSQFRTQRADERLPVHTRSPVF
jgi:hypothetical protein